jgi:hypothetical protein
MTLEALLTFAGILAAVLAVARPVQRRSLILFASVWRLGFAILLSFFLIFCRDAPFGMSPPFGWPLPTVLFSLTIGAFLIPVLAALWSWASWHRAKLTGNKIKHVEKLFQAALREHEFDEVERIVRNNLQNLDRLPSSAVSVLFDRAMVAALVDSHSLVHLESLSDMDFLKSLDFGAVDAVVRVLLRSDVSPLRSAVIEKYGGLEHLKYTDAERDLMEKTFENPDWYVAASAHYPLVISAVEALRSGKFDDDYNNIGRDYEADQGISSRTYCPVYLAVKTEVIAIEAAIENKFEQDLYISDLFDIFRAVQERSIFDQAVWESSLSNPEFPTPYAYLLYEISADHDALSATAVVKSISRAEPPQAEPPGLTARVLAQNWSFCTWNIAGSENEVSPDFRKSIIRRYLRFVLALGWGPSEVGPGVRNNTRGLDVWRDLFVGELQRRYLGNPSSKQVLKDAMVSLDRGKVFVSEGYEWLEEKLFGTSRTS